VIKKFLFTMSRYLKDDEYYIDLYDLHTVEECLSYYNGIKENFKKRRTAKNFKKFSEKEFDKEVNKVASYIVNMIKAKRYERKKEVIQEWKEKDRKDQEKFDNAIAPQRILCKKCFSPAKVILKNLDGLHEEDSKVLFFFECIKCKKRQVIYEDGTERHSEKAECPKCSYPLDEKFTYTEDVLTTFYSCPNCSYKNKETCDFSKSDKEQEEREVRERGLLEEYRKEFCVSDEVGENMLRTYKFLSELYDEYKEKERRSEDPIIQQVKKIKKLTVIQFKKLIRGGLEKEGYADLKFGKPEIGKYVIVDFSVLETKDERKEYDSQRILKKLINGLLVNTNWRLMSDGINYRLGILTGRLKAYEREEDLVEIIKKKKKYL
jgi:hypothetical protein